MFYSNWYERGIRFVNDLFDENGFYCRMRVLFRCLISEPFFEVLEVWLVGASLI